MTSENRQFPRPGDAASGRPECLPDHRRAPRRRGDDLSQAIFDAALAELAESGYAGMAMERVATRARASKASLYRRWASRAELVADALGCGGPDPQGLPDAGSLRGDLLALLRGLADGLGGPFGEAVRGVLADTLADPERTAAVRARVVGTRQQLLAEVVDRACERGEVRGPPPSRCALTAAPVLLLHYYLTHGAPVPDRVIREIVDEVALPLLGVPGSGAAEAGAERPGPDWAGGARSGGGRPGAR
jgi:AcrR family transcriptional regulator